MICFQKYFSRKLEHLVNSSLCILQVIFLAISICSVVEKAYEDSATSTTPVRLSKKSRDIHLKEAGSTSYWNTEKMRVSPCPLNKVLLNCFCSKQKSIMFHWSLTSPLLFVCILSTQWNSCPWSCKTFPVWNNLPAFLLCWDNSSVEGWWMFTQRYRNDHSQTEMATGKYKLQQPWHFNFSDLV